LASAVGGGDVVVVECACDLGEAAAAGVVEVDAFDDAPGQCRRPARCAGFVGVAGRLEVVAEKAFEFGDGDQPLPPGGLDCVQGGDEVTVDRGDAEAERFGGLLAAVGETFGLDDLLQLAWWCPDQLWVGAPLAEELLVAPFLPPRAHAAAYSNPGVG